MKRIAVYFLVCSLISSCVSSRSYVTPKNGYTFSKGDTLLTTIMIHSNPDLSDYGTEKIQSMFNKCKGLYVLPFQEGQKRLSKSPIGFLQPYEEMPKNQMRLLKENTNVRYLLTGGLLDRIVSNPLIHDPLTSFNKTRWVTYIFKLYDSQEERLVLNYQNRVKATNTEVEFTEGFSIGFYSILNIDKIGVRKSIKKLYRSCHCTGN